MQRLNTVLLTTLLVMAPLSAFAALGGNAGSAARTPSTPRTQMSATLSNGYTIQEQVTESGISVREYVSAQGVVFAVVWEGPTMPDLQQLLGSYFPQFSNAMSQRRDRGVRGPVALKQDDLVVESRGHLRDYSGRAYVPSLLPPQVSIEEIQ